MIMVRNSYITCTISSSSYVMNYNSGYTVPFFFDEKNGDSLTNSFFIGRSISKFYESHSALGSESVCRSRGGKFIEIDQAIITTVILLLRLIQEGLLSVTSKMLFTKYWLTA